MAIWPYNSCHMSCHCNIHKVICCFISLQHQLMHSWRYWRGCHWVLPAEGSGGGIEGNTEWQQGWVAPQDVWLGCWEYLVFWVWYWCHYGCQWWEFQVGLMALGEGWQETGSQGWSVPHLPALTPSLAPPPDCIPAEHMLIHVYNIYFWLEGCVWWLKKIQQMYILAQILYNT